MSSTTVDHLSDLQIRMRQPETDRVEIVDEMKVLMHHLAADPHDRSGLRMGAVGGMIFCLSRMLSHINDQRQVAGEKVLTLAELADMYATVELTSFIKPDADLDILTNYARNKRLTVGLAPLHTTDGTQYNVLVSQSDQKGEDGVDYVKGEMIHNPFRYPPPWRKLKLQD